MMNKQWVNTAEHNTACIIFFNGWGMDARAISKLDATGYDILHLNDYDLQVFDWQTIDLGAYEQVYLVAWSLGVWSAANSGVFEQVKLTKAIALNGTVNPIHAEEGIAPATFAATLTTWNERNRTKFNMRMFGGRTFMQQYSDCLAERSIENQQAELQRLQDHILITTAPEVVFDCALVGDTDAIFTACNQINYWQDRTRVLPTVVPHFVFGNFATWNQIISL